VWQIDPPPENRSQSVASSRLRLALGLIFGAMILGATFYFAADAVAAKIARKLKEQIQYARSRHGLIIDYQTMDVGVGFVTLAKLTIGGQPWLDVEGLRVDLSLNPFSDFLRPAKVTMKKVKINVPASEESWPDELKKLKKRLVEDKKLKTTSQVFAGAAFLPKRLEIFLDRLDWSDDHKSILNMDTVSMTLRARERRFALRTLSVVALDRVKESFIETEINREPDQQIRLNIRGRPEFKGKPDWSASCLIRRDPLSGKCDVDAGRLPDLLLTPFQSRLGKAFKPGYRGGVGVEALDGTNLKRIRLSTRGVLENIIVDHPALSLSPVGPVNIRTNMNLDIDVQESSISAADSELFVFAPGAEDGEGVRLSAEFALSLAKNYGMQILPRGNLQLHAEKIDCSALIHTIPHSFAPEFLGFEMDGAAALRAQINLDDKGAKFSISGSRFDCNVIKTPEMYSADYLASAFVIERQTPAGKITIPVDPARPYFVSYTDIPVLVRSAFISSEDTGFFSHQGVEIGAIVGAVEKNAEVKRAAVGGSTITMQTVKNLFLARDKTLSRKLQEMFLAWHLERTITKERILEIYLNMVEFGPGLYGIGRASQKFFSKDPRDLTLKEAIYLASLLPAPIPRYRYFCAGELTPNYNKIVKQLLDRMLALGRITVLQHQAALAEKLEFSKIERESACADVRAHQAQDSEASTDY
jgi:hypothetical protein